VSDSLIIQSHTGPYRVDFQWDGVSALDRDFPADAHFIIDRRVAQLHGPRMLSILAHGSVLLIDASEDAKSLDRFPDYVAHLVDRKIRRDHVLIAIGGGITQDITCFLAATLLRGVEWRFVPTTLLAQTDSCIGSKSSINCGEVKNILGTFTPPRRVLVDARFLETLDHREVLSGVGEMLKAHAVAGPDALAAFHTDYAALFTDAETMQRRIRASLEIKRHLIEADEFDRGIRNVFNYGHSFGHALETATDFAIPHGIAVSMGMDMANFVAAGLKVGDNAYFQRFHPLYVANYRGYALTPVDEDRFFAALGKDKKNVGTGTVTLILPDHQGTIARGIHADDDAFRQLCRQFLNAVRTEAA
jgi:3-dehydroquinate synthase